jgi:serine/threonine-protein kinase
MGQLVQQQEWSRPASVSAHLDTIDPVIERVILRCLEKDPALRPPSALAVAAGLPGGDPLAAALAAGETPSPEMVAAAGGEGALRLPVAALLLGLFVAGLVAVALSTPWTSLIGRAGLGKPPSVLAERAREVLAGAGYTTPPADKASGFYQNSDYLAWLHDNGAGSAGWSELASAQRPAFGFWYRESPRPLEPQNPDGIVYLNDPVPLSPGMAQVLLDSWGRLSSLNVVPPQVDPSTAGAASTDPATKGAKSTGSGITEATSTDAATAAAAAATTPGSAAIAAAPADHPPADWGKLFASAGLDMAAFELATPKWVPLFYADTRAAWEGPLPWQPGVTGRVEAASFQGRPVQFAVIGPWTQPRRSVPYVPSTSERVGQALNVIFFMMLLCGAVVLGRWNIRAGRGDRKGAFRLALFMFVAGLITWLVRADHVSSFGAEWEQFVRASAVALFDAGLVWLLYIALEPFVRWRWADSIVGWTRLIGGGFRDPLVGRDILIGLVIGVGMVGIWRIRPVLETLFAATESVPAARGFMALSGPGSLIAGLLDGQKNAIQSAMILLFFSFMGVGTMKVRWPAWLIFGSISVLMGFLMTPSTSLPARLLMSVAYAVCLTTLLMRFGVLAAIAALLVNSWTSALTLDFSAWNAPQVTVLWLLLLGLGGYAFWISMGRRAPLAFERPGRG